MEFNNSQVHQVENTITKPIRNSSHCTFAIRLSVKSSNIIEGNKFKQNFTLGIGSMPLCCKRFTFDEHHLFGDYDFRVQNHHLRMLPEWGL